MPGPSRKESWWGKKRNLHILLFKFRGSLATDQRDRIFALIGMSSDASDSKILVADYKKSLSDVIRDTSLFLLSEANADCVCFKSTWRLREGATMHDFLRGLDVMDVQALLLAAEEGLEENIKLLLAAGLDVNTTARGDSPLLRAVKNGHTSTVKVLLENRAKTEVRCRNRRTPLTWASLRGHNKVVELLLESGADVNSEDDDGKTSLLWAIENGNISVVESLLKAGARLSYTTRWDGKEIVALDWATQLGAPSMVQFLREYMQMHSIPIKEDSDDSD